MTRPKTPLLTAQDERIEDAGKARKADEEPRVLEMAGSIAQAHPMIDKSRRS